MKKLLSVLAVAIAVMSMQAAPVDPAMAQRIAKNYLSQMYAGKMMAPSALNPVLLKAEIGDIKTAKPVYYIFNTSTTYLVVAGDDRAEQILMVGDAPLPDVNKLPLGMIDMLNIYKEQIQYLHEHPGLQVERISDSNNAPTLNAVTYGPLLTAIWDQDAPFWNQCKFTYNGTSYQCYTGCPATSASMVLYYWKYPASVEAIPSYSATLELSYYNSVSYTYPALPAVAFDWPNMKDSYTGSYTTAQGTAVATLMRYVGQAEGMMYGTAAAGGSGIYVSENYRIADMFKLFGYKSTAKNVTKSSYSAANWNSLIQSELAAGRPLVYCAVSSTEGGHAFNVDGYRDSDNKYHVNWGWSGSGNNWFAMDAFSDGSGTFNQSQQAIIGVEPPDVPSVVPEITATPSSLSFTASTGSTVTKTFVVKGTDLFDGVTITKSGSTYFTVSPSTLTKEQAAAGATVTVTYSPVASGTNTASITLSSTGAENKTVSLTGTATVVPMLTATPNSLSFDTEVGAPVTQTFVLKGSNLTSSSPVTLSVSGNGFSIDKTSVTRAAVMSTNGVTVTVTYKPTTVGNHTGTVSISHADASTITVALAGQASIAKYAPVMLPAVQDYINLTQFRADWTDATPATNVTSYTLEVTPKPTVPEVELIGSLAGTSFTGSATGYYDITLSAPWSGVNTRGGLNSIIYFRNLSTGAGSISYTVPQGYSNALFTMKITSGSSSDGAGNLAVGTPQTAAVNHTFVAGETYYWLVNASAGEKITITSSDANFSPDMTLIEVYTGDARPATLMATETGDENSRLITGIADKFYTVENLAAEGTFLYRVKTLYIDGTESDWSNVEEVTLFQNGHGYDLGDVNHDGAVNIADVTRLIDYLLAGGEICETCADVTGDSTVNIADVTALIDLLLGGSAPTLNVNAPAKDSGR